MLQDSQDLANFLLALLSIANIIASELETRIGRALIAGDVTEGSVIEVGLKDGALDVAVRGVQPSGREAAAAVA